MGKKDPSTALAVLLIVSAVLYSLWLYLFFSRLRPAVRERLSRKLGVTVHRSYKGYWEVPDGTPWQVGLRVSLSDIGSFLAGLIGPLSIVGLLVYLIVSVCRHG